MANIASAAKRSGSIRHMVLVSSGLILRPSLPAHKILNYLFDNTLFWKLRGENHFRSSGIPFTIIRPYNLDKISPYPSEAKHLNIPSSDLWCLAPSGQLCSKKRKERELENVGNEATSGWRDSMPWATEIEKKVQDRLILDQGGASSL